MKRVFYMLATLIFAIPSAYGKVIEEVVTVENSYRTLFGTTNHPMLLTIWRDDTKSHTPVMVLHHGRGDPKKPDRVRLPVAAKYFVSMGFAVLVPTRIGYGKTGGPDLEYSSFSSAFYKPIAEAGADATEVVIKYAKTLHYVDATQIVVAGGSYGGGIAVASGARNTPGVLAFLNFAGGFGGDVTRPQMPPNPYGTESLFADYGKVSKIPSLWIYGGKDEYWGKDYPVQWFNAYRKHGADAEWLVIPDEGHKLYGNAQAWGPAVLKFLRGLGIKISEPPAGRERARVVIMDDES